MNPPPPKIQNIKNNIRIQRFTAIIFIIVKKKSIIRKFSKLFRNDFTILAYLLPDFRSQKNFVFDHRNSNLLMKNMFLEPQAIFRIIDKKTSCAVL